MIKKEIIEKEVHCYFCDICIGESDTFVRTDGRQCHICERHVCRKHFIYDPHEHGDYPPVWCRICWAISEPFIKELEKEEEIYCEKTEEIEKRMKEKCLDFKKEKKHE
ncbi:MAG: hypothetical protein WC755_02055 [Candidatus Woesearchaeota archaeon]